MELRGVAGQVGLRVCRGEVGLKVCRGVGLEITLPLLQAAKFEDTGVAGREGSGVK